MSLYRFPLERVLRVRVLEETSARGHWSEAEGVARAAESRVQSLRQQLTGARRDLSSERQTGQVTAQALLTLEASLAQIEHCLAQNNEQALTLRFQAEEWREAWREKRIEREALERLRDRQRTRHAEEENTRETQRLDEVASVQHSRRQLPPDPLQFREGGAR